MRLIFQTRFSFLGKLSWRSETSRLPELLFAPERLERRLQLFENVMLPSIADQTDDDFELVILTSDVLPAKYLDRVTQVLDENLGKDRVTILQSPPARCWRVVQEHMSAEYSDREDVVQVNLDDDDAVSVDFVEVCKLQAKTALQVDYFGDPWRMLSFAQGYNVNYIDGYLADINPTHMPLSAPGLAIAGPPTVEMSPMVHIDHGQIVPNSLVVTTDRPFFLKALHDFNDKSEWQDTIEHSVDDFVEAQTFFPALLDALRP